MSKEAEVGEAEQRDAGASHDPYREFQEQDDEDDKAAEQARQYMNTEVMGNSAPVEGAIKRAAPVPVVMSEAKRKALVEHIQQKILPNFVIIRTPSGVIGSGFFRHAEWLVTNAHVLPTYELLEGARFFNSHGEVNFEITQSFHRPAGNDAAPDLVILNGKVVRESAVGGDPLPLDRSINGLAPWLSANVKPTRCYYYISNETGLSLEERIHYLDKTSEPGVHPVTYRRKDGRDPQPGESGSPVFEAALQTDSRELTWHSHVVDALYARCPASWNNNNEAIRTVPAPERQKLVCAIPADYDFEQIRTGYLLLKGKAERWEAMALAAASGESLRDRVLEYELKAAGARVEMEAMLQSYAEGETSLNIDLLDGLEKLLGRGVIPLSQSMLLGTSASKWGINVGNILHNKPPAHKLGELQQSFEAFVRKIENLESSPLVGADFNQAILKSGESRPLFRLDQVGGSGGVWRLELQDNTDIYYGRRRSGPPISSTFGVVTVPKGGGAIDWSVIARALRESQQTSVEEHSKITTQQLGRKNPNISYKFRKKFPDAVKSYGVIFKKIQEGAATARAAGGKKKGAHKKGKSSTSAKRHQRLEYESDLYAAQLRLLLSGNGGSKKKKKKKKKKALVVKERHEAGQAPPSSVEQTGKKKVRVSSVSMLKPLPQRSRASSSSSEHGLLSSGSEEKPFEGTEAPAPASS